MLDDLVSNFRLEKAKLLTIPNPVDLARIKRLSKEHDHIASQIKNNKTAVNLIYVGGLRQEKNIESLLEALTVDGCSRCCLHILGDGGLSDKLMLKCRALNLETRVFFHGFCNNPYPALIEADALILVSHYEGLPNVVLEAMALGKRVLATPAGGICEELLDGVSGCQLATGATPEEISAMIRQFVDAPEPMQAPKLPPKYNASKINEIFEDLIDNS